MSETLQVPNYLRGHVSANKSLEKLGWRIFRKSGSLETVSTYVRETVAFCKWLKVTPDKAIKSRYDWAVMINDYLDHLMRRDIARNTMLKSAAGIKKWFEINEIDIDWKRIELPKRWNVERDQIPTREELKKILGCTDLTDRVLTLLAVSSGLRMNNILCLRLKHFNLEREMPTVVMPAEMTKNRRSFLTFITPEAKASLMVYLKEREMRGEHITHESYVIVSERRPGYSVTDRELRKEPYQRERITKQAAEMRWMHILERAGLAEKEEGKKWHLLHFHVLRKYFKSWSSLSGVNSEVVEFFMGHRASIAQTYFIPNADNLQPEIIARLEAEYRKALPALTIMSEGEKVKELEESLAELKEEVEEKSESLRRREESLKEKEVLLEQMDRRIRKLEKIVREKVKD